MFQIVSGEYILRCQSNGLPSLIHEYSKHAALVDNIDISKSDATACFLSVGKSNKWPFLVVSQRYEPGPEAGFYPGAIIIPETKILFVGAGERLLAYDLNAPQRIWKDTADTGFWFWERYGDTIIMSAELECAAWNLNGNKLWSTFVEPPWEYVISQNTIILDVMGKKYSFPLEEGPQ